MNENCTGLSRAVQPVKEPPLLSRSESGGLLQFGEKLANASRKKEFLQLQFASFFRFMATNLSLTHLVTAAKPR